MMWKKVYSLVVVVSILVIVQGCEDTVPPGEQLARKTCSSCHKYPAPGELDKNTWMKYVLPQMGGFLGFRLFEGGTYFEDDRIERSISIDDWNTIVQFYIATAPAKISTAERTHSISGKIPFFETYRFPYRKSESATTFIAIDSTHRLLFGDGVSSRLYRANSTLTGIEDSISAGTGLADVLADSSGMYLLSMGVLTPSDALKGKLMHAKSFSGNATVLIDSLQRPVDFSYMDLNSDGRKDFVICEFGNTSGSLAWYEHLSSGAFTKHTLRPLPGAVHTEIADFNKDGLPDIIALMAQGDEGMFIYYNLGQNQFKESRILQFSPAYGSNSFQLYDFNKDGHPDIVASNGDNGDYPPILKPYHGLRIYINDGNNRFSEEVFIHVDGASKVIAADFDNDGNADLASIAYFADYENHPEESFVLWKNSGDFEFSGYSFPEVNAGRWLTMDANDIDGDGDMDIVLGNANFSMGKIPPNLKEEWNRTAPSVIVLKNSARRR
ncbi:MAG TPA: VCBS repeat-containing protein [Flavitalea sp.]|nr:VCBS repeat-containing protein [Flavitalea sp.]